MTVPRRGSGYGADSGDINRDSRERLLLLGFLDEEIIKLYDAGHGPFYARWGAEWIVILFEATIGKPEKEQSLRWILPRLFDLGENNDWSDRVAVMKLLGGTLPHGGPGTRPWNEHRVRMFLQVAEAALAIKYPQSPIGEDGQ